MNFLTVAGIFKNESHVIKEWVEHYLNEGADHFFLIDNGSTDNYRGQIEEYIEDGLITIVHDETKWAQVELYNKYFSSLKNKTKWLLICDLDEFVYSRRGFSTVRSFLESLSRKVGVIRIPWKVYGSNSLVEQPKSVIQSFTLRAEQVKGQKPWMRDENRTLSKVIVKPELVEKYHIHFHYLSDSKCRVIGATKKKLKYPEDPDQRNFQPINEKILKRSYLHLNHYALQSRNWFLDVKCNRGAADTKAHDEVRNISYFEGYDAASNDIKDDELAKKTY